MKGKHFLALAASLAMLFALGACNGNGSGSNGSASVTISAAVDGGTMAAHGKHGGRSKPTDTTADITSLTVDIQSGSDFITQGLLLTPSGGTWTVTVQDLPVGEQLVFTGHAYNAGGEEIFTGMTTQALTGVNDEVVITMTPATNNSNLNLLQITKITRPAEVLASGGAPVSVSVLGNEGETLTYEIIAAENGGSFSPSAGSIVLSNYYATIVVNYTAPATTGDYVHTVRITNAAGNTTETTFTTSVASELTQSDITVQFQPVITAVVPARTGSNVTLTAYVSDPGDPAALTYDWGFTCWSGCGTVGIVDPEANPAVLSGYDVSVTGKITLTVSNGAGSTTIHYSVSYGQFADTVVSNLVLLPQTPIPTNTDDCRYGAVSGNIVTLVVPENDVQQDLNNDGDQSDSVLHYIDVTQGTPVNTGIAVSQRSIAIDGDIIVFQYSDGGWQGTTMGWYNIGTGESQDTGITPLSFGREYWGSTRVVSNGMIAYAAQTRDLTGDEVNDEELNLYEISTGVNTPTGVQLGWGSIAEDIVPSIDGDIVAHISTAGTIAYYTISTGIDTDTGIEGGDPTVDNGIIVFNAPTDTIWYYEIAQGKAVATNLPVNRNYNASISDGIIAIAINEDDTWGDLNGDGQIGGDDSGIIVLYDIPTGRMVSTGVMLCCGPEISGFVIAIDWDTCDQWYIVLDDLVKQYFNR